MRPRVHHVLLLLSIASPAAAQSDVPVEDVLKPVLQSFAPAGVGREAAVQVPDHLPEVAAAAREIGLRTTTAADAIECEGEDRRRCRLPAAGMLISLDDLKIQHDSASVLVGLAFGSRERFDELYLQIWYVKLVRRGTEWQVAERRLEIET